MKWLNVYEARRMAQDRRAEECGYWSDIMVARTKSCGTQFMLQWLDLDEGEVGFYPSGNTLGVIFNIHEGLEISAEPVREVEDFTEVRRLAQDLEVRQKDWSRMFYVYWKENCLFRSLMTDPWTRINWIDPDRWIIQFTDTDRNEFPVYADHPMVKAIQSIVAPY